MSPTAANSLIFGSVASAFRCAEELWRTLPRPDAVRTEVLAKAFEAAFFGPLPTTTDPKELNLRRPQFTACFTGIFGGGTTGFPGEFALANYGVLLFPEFEHFNPEIIDELAKRLREPGNEHTAGISSVPEPLASLPLPRVQLD